MKKLKRIYCWILISVLMQTAVLAYINYVYLPGRGGVRATIFEAETAAVKNRSMKLPENAENVTVSFDGLYAAYRQGDELVIADIDRKKTIKKLNPAGGTFSYFRWLPDREMLIYSIKEPEGKKGKVRISTYDIVPELDRSYPDITGLPEESEIINIELSPLTNVVYPLIKTSDSRARIYKFDIMDNLKLIKKTDLTTVIKETMYTDTLIYQLEDGTIRVRDGRTGKLTKLPVKEAKLLLDTDDRDFIYLAAADENGKLTSVFYGKDGQKEEEWKTVKLEKPLEKSDIYITAEGAIYAADKQKSSVYALEGNGAADYQGELLNVLDSYVVSMEGNKLILRMLKK